MDSTFSKFLELLTAPWLSITDITDSILDMALKLTNSEHGYVSSIDPENGDSIGHTLSCLLGEQCRVAMESRRVVFPRKPDGSYPGLWGHSLNTGRAFYTNFPRKHRTSIGLPKGHIPIRNLLAIPIKLGNELAGQIALANKKKGRYGRKDIHAISRLCEYYALALQRMRSEHELKQYQTGLEKRVEERTNELVKVMLELESEIVERKQKEKALRESEEKYSSLVENSITGIAIIHNGAIVFANTQLSRIFQYSGEELIGFDPRHLLAQEEKESYGQSLANLLQGKNYPVEKIYKGQTRDKKTIWVDIRHASIIYRGSPAVLANVMDVTGRKEMEHLLGIQDKMTSLGRVAAGIAHELRNPLSGLNIHLTNLERLLAAMKNFDPESQEKLDRIIENLKQASGKIESVVKRVYDFSRPSMHNLMLVDVNICIQEVIQIAAVQMRKKNIAMEQRLSHPPLHCEANQNLLEQLLMNLVTNAIQILDSIESEKKIIISSRLQNHEIIITVEDSGPGVSPSLREKIFDPFVTSRYDGLGIGLSICFRIVKDHGGVLEVGTSEELGGAAFKITLPMKPRGRNQGG